MVASCAGVHLGEAVTRRHQLLAQRCLHCRVAIGDAVPWCRPARDERQPTARSRSRAGRRGRVRHRPSAPRAWSIRALRRCRARRWRAIAASSGVVSVQRRHRRSPDQQQRERQADGDGGDGHDHLRGNPCQRATVGVGGHRGSQLEHATVGGIGLGPERWKRSSSSACADDPQIAGGGWDGQRLGAEVDAAATARCASRSATRSSSTGADRASRAPSSACTSDIGRRRRLASGRCVQRARSSAVVADSARSTPSSSAGAAVASATLDLPPLVEQRIELALVPATVDIGHQERAGTASSTSLALLRIARCASKKPPNETALDRRHLRELRPLVTQQRRGRNRWRRGSASCSCCRVVEVAGRPAGRGAPLRGRRGVRRSSACVGHGKCGG